jgi:DNA-binding beta-propeller fold protein YncE
MKRLALVLAVIVATLVVGLATRPVLAASVDAIVTLKDFNFEFITDTDIPDCADPQRPCATTDNPVGVAVDSRGDIKVGILGLSIFGPNGLPVPGQERPSTPIKTVTPEGRVSDFASLPLFTDLQPCRDARPGRDFILPAQPQLGLQEPTPFSTGFALHRSGDLYVGLPNCDPATHGIWRVKEDGSTEPFAQVPLSQLPKGLALTNGDFPLYVTDLHDFTHSRDADLTLRPDVPNCRVAPTAPCTLRIWRIDQNGQVSIWKESTLFYGSVDSPLLHPHGVNGIAVDKAGKNVYVTVTDHGRVIRIPVNKDGSAGDTEVIFESPIESPPDAGGNPLNQGLPRYWGMDGITIGPDGNFYIVIVRTDELVALPPDLPACTDSPPLPCNGNSILVLHQGHPLDGPTQLTFGRSMHDGKHSKAGKSLPALYITNASGRRTFFVNGARLFGEGDLLSGIGALISFGAISEQEAIDLQPRSSLVRVLLSTGTTGSGDD